MILMDETTKSREKGEFVIGVFLDPSIGFTYRKSWYSIKDKESSLYKRAWTNVVC